MLFYNIILFISWARDLTILSVIYAVDSTAAGSIAG